MEKPRITAKIAGRALHPLLRPFVIGYFFAACACDLVYSQASIFAQNDAGDFASITEWLLGAGLVAAGLTALVALIDLFGEQRFRRLPDAWMYGAGGVLVAVLALYNLDIRFTSGSEAILPMGLILSLSTVAVLLATPSRSWARMYR
jgi:uncharacterized membrane protein